MNLIELPSRPCHWLSSPRSMPSAVPRIVEELLVFVATVSSYQGNEVSFYLTSTPCKSEGLLKDQPR